MPSHHRAGRRASPHHPLTRVSVHVSPGGWMHAAKQVSPDGRSVVVGVVVLRIYDSCFQNRVWVPFAVSAPVHGARHDVWALRGNRRRRPPQVWDMQAFTSAEKRKNFLELFPSWELLTCYVHLPTISPHKPTLNPLFAVTTYIARYPCIILSDHGPTYLLHYSQLKGLSVQCSLTTGL